MANKTRQELDLRQGWGLYLYRIVTAYFLQSFRVHTMGQPQNVSANVDHNAIVVQSSEELKQKHRKWYYYLWDTLDKPPEERWFMFKLDAALLTFASLGTLQIAKDLDYQMLKSLRLLHQILGSE